MPPYDLTIRLRVELADDAEARELCEDGLLQDVALAARDYYTEESIPVAAELQRIYDNRPPRLLAKWPE